MKADDIGLKAYRCPKCGQNVTLDSDKGLNCSSGHAFPFIPGKNIPVFDSEDENVNEYTIEEAAEIHENALRWLFATFGGDEHTLRNNLVSRLRLEAGQNILVTGAGAGNDLPAIAKQVGKEGVIYAQDYSRQMLESAAARCAGEYGLADYQIHFSVSEATNLPFQDNLFDAVFHFGGLNLFSDIGKGIAEMDRVVKDGGRVVFGDEGLPVWLKNTDYGKMVITNNPLCDFEAPLLHLPVTARGVNLSWEVGYCFYVIDYTASNEPLKIDMDVPHIGRRGGSIRTRYYGQLEGIDPDLKDQIYAEAEKRGFSRVAFLEDLLRNGLEQ